MMVARIISALVAVGIIIPTLIWGGVPGVAVLVAVFSALGAWELTNNLSSLKTVPSRFMAIALGVLIVILFYWVPIPYVPAVMALFPLIAVLLHLFFFKVIENTIDSVTQVIFVGAYLVTPLAHAVLLSRLDATNVWLFFVLFVVCLSDVGAFFAGKYLGKTHFSKEVSPRKTVEGLVGGLAGAIVGMLLIKMFASDMPPLLVLFEATVILSITGPIGDLSASAIKRRLGIKDFGTIMPGHGGVMDRADSLIPSIPVLYYFLLASGYGLVV